MGELSKSNLEMDTARWRLARHVQDFRLKMAISDMRERGREIRQAQNQELEEGKTRQEVLQERKQLLARRNAHRDAVNVALGACVEAIRGALDVTETEELAQDGMAFRLDGDGHLYHKYHTAAIGDQLDRYAAALNTRDGQDLLTIIWTDLKVELMRRFRQIFGREFFVVDFHTTRGLIANESCACTVEVEQLHLVARRRALGE